MDPEPGPTLSIYGLLKALRESGFFRRVRLVDRKEALLHARVFVETGEKLDSKYRGAAAERIDVRKGEIESQRARVLARVLEDLFPGLPHPFDVELEPHDYMRDEVEDFETQEEVFSIPRSAFLFFTLGALEVATPSKGRPSEDDESDPGAPGYIEKYFVESDPDWVFWRVKLESDREMLSHLAWLIRTGTCRSLGEYAAALNEAGYRTRAHGRFSKHNVHRALVSAELYLATQERLAQDG